VSASTIFGTLSNFDVINDTGGDCHGFEIELEGVSKLEVSYTFGAPWNRYGNPTIEDKPDGTGVYIRYKSTYDPVTQQFMQATPQPPALLASPPQPITSTNGHACYQGGPIGNYATSGCEHFGISLRRNPTKTVYRWLVAHPQQPGQLTPIGTPVSIVAPVWTIQPPANPAVDPRPVVRAVIPEEPPEVLRACARFGEAKWVKIFKTEIEHHVELDNLLSDDPLVPQDPSQTEIEWALLQAVPTCDENGAAVVAENELANEAPLGEGNESVIRRYEFYKYVGAYDAETHEATPPDDTDPYVPDANGNVPLGDYIGAQMAAINVLPPLSIMSAVLPVGEVGVVYAEQALVRGGVPPYSSTVVGGALPAGLQLDAATGVLFGTPTQALSTTFTVAVTDDEGTEVVSDPLTLTIVDAVRVSTVSLPAGTSGKAYSQTLTAAYGVSPYTWSLAGGSLPTGLTLSSSGTLAGTPSVTGTFTPTFKVTDALGATAQQGLSLTITASTGVLRISTSSLPSGTTGKAYTKTLAAVNGVSPYTWSLAGGSLPTGLTLSSSGTLAGTPSVTGTFTPTFKVTDSKGAVAQKSLSLTIASASTTKVEGQGTITALGSNYIAVNGVKVYYNSNTVVKFNDVPGYQIGLPAQYKGYKDANGKITATSLEIN
jgi:hypothetical protein